LDPVTRNLDVLNLYCGVGGNRLLWKNVNVTAIENNPAIANIYSELYPDDLVIQCNAHKFLKNNHNTGYDFIWSSPPCQSHSQIRKNLAVRYHGAPPIYPDMRLYEEILFLQNYAPKHVKWVVENTQPYYEPLITPTVKIQRHLFWSNFSIPEHSFPADQLRSAQIPQLQKHHGIDLTGYRLPNKRQVLRNCLHPLIGDYIFECARSSMQ
jgi:DNA (cytosine-5)-methyltransferase 1